MENQPNLELNEQAVDALRTSSKWSMFLAIMGFIGIGFMVLGAIVMTSVMSMIPSSPMSPFGNFKGFISGFYIVMAILYFPPVYYLYKYASDMKNALLSSSSDMVGVALGYLKSHHKYLGISIIVIISLYIIFIIGMIAMFATKGLGGMH
jgi:hypothetical protein